MNRWGYLLALPFLLGGVACSDEKSNGHNNTNGGVVILPDGAVVPADGGATGNVNGDGGTNGAIGNPDGGAVAMPPTSTEYIEDATGQSGLDQGTIDRLKQGGDSCSAKMLYPYEGTVFPGGLISPLMMWEGGSDASYVHLRYDSSKVLDYQYAAGASNPGAMRIPQEHWDQIVRRTQGQDLLITFTTISGGNVSTCETKWRIATGNMVGAIYYNTYNHPETGGQGAVVRLRLGQPQADVYSSYQGVAVPLTGPCKSCHSVSFDGSTLVSSQHDYASKVFEVNSFNITDDLQPPAQTTLDNATFGALTPSGDKILAMGNPQCTAGADTFPRASNNMPLIEGPDVARLIDTQTDQIIPAAGLNPDWYMWMPQFSPDGDAVVFNHAKPDGNGGTDRRQLAVMSYDPATDTFGAPEVIVDGLGPAPSLPYAPAAASGGPISTGKDDCTEGAEGIIPLPLVPGNLAELDPGVCEEPCYPSWPFFTPDGNGVVFALNSHPDFASALPGRDEQAKSELWYVDIRTGEAVRLDNANKGLAPGDSLHNYYPTVLPVQVGGYFWVFWTSTRDWGHQQLVDPNAVAIAPPGTPGFSESYLQAPRKRIWVTALRPHVAPPEFDLPELTDLSAPAFYLEGQSDTGNVRAFAALNPCLDNGNSCTSGLDCCSGYCNFDPETQTGVCVEEPPMCAELNDKCEANEDCCQPEEGSGEPERVCLGGYCGFVVIQ